MSFRRGEEPHVVFSLRLILVLLILAHLEISHGGLVQLVRQYLEHLDDHGQLQLLAEGAERRVSLAPELDHRQRSVALHQTWLMNERNLH